MKTTAYRFIVPGFLAPVQTVLVILALLGSPLVLTGCSSSSPKEAGGGDADLMLYRGVMDRVQESYVEPVSKDTLVSNALKGMLTGLDPHSDYMTESEYRDMLDDSQGEFAGIGAELTRDDNRPKIISPIDDTPAARAGIKPGDVIIRIDGKLTDGMSLKDVVDQLRGPAGSDVRLTIDRGGAAPIEMKLTRAIIHVASVKSSLEPDRLGYARISSFAENTQDEMVAAIAALTRQAGGRLNGFVLDLRDDPGGLLDAAVDVSGDFLDGGVVVTTQGRDEDDDRVYRTRAGGDRLKGAPMVVLINGASASASEIVAGALQDRHRAEILGTRSFGKGSVQTIIPLDGRGALRLTTARYYTPSGRSIQAAGITPDKVVQPPRTGHSDTETLHEADLRGALVNTGPATTATPGPATAGPGNGEGAEADLSIDPQMIGTAQDTQLTVALGELHQMITRAQASAQVPGSR